MEQSSLKLTQLIGTKITDLFTEHLEAVKGCDYDQKLKDEFSALIRELRSEFDDAYADLQDNIDNYVEELSTQKTKLLADYFWKQSEGTSDECYRKAVKILE